MAALFHQSGFSRARTYKDPTLKRLLILLLFFTISRTLNWKSLERRNRRERIRSTFTCYDGIEEKDDIDSTADDPHSRTCLFRDVCYNFKTSRFTYFSPRPTEVLGFPNRTALDEFPPDFVDLQRSIATGAGSFSLANIEARKKDGFSFSPVLHHGRVPRRARYAPSATYVLNMPFASFNFGHVTIDTLLPAFLSSIVFQLDPHDITILVTSNLSRTTVNQASRDVLRMFSKRYPVTIFNGNDEPPRDLQHLISVSQTKLVQDLFSGPVKLPHQLLCFERLIAGSPRAGLSHGGGPLWTHFVDHIVRSLGRRTLADFKLPIRKHNVLLLFKEPHERRSTVNARDLLAYLQRIFPKIEISIMYGSHLNNMGLADQAKIAMKHSVIVTDAGGISFLTMFMRPGSACVIMSYYSGKANRPNRLEVNVWRYETRRKILHYPVWQEEVQLRRPASSSDKYMFEQWDSSSYWQYRNFGHAVIDMKRMERLVQSCLDYVSDMNGLPLVHPLLTE